MSDVDAPFSKQGKTVIAILVSILVIAGGGAAAASWLDSRVATAASTAAAAVSSAAVVAAATVAKAAAVAETGALAEQARDHEQRIRALEEMRADVRFIRMELERQRRQR